MYTKDTQRYILGDKKKNIHSNIAHNSEYLEIIQMYNNNKMNHGIFPQCSSIKTTS